MTRDEERGRADVPPQPAVTVVTVVRNGARTIEGTIESVLAQRGAAIDYLVIDGASTDGTLEILRRYEGRLRFRSEPDRGLYDGMNKALRMISDPERYVIFLNADDRFVSSDSVASVLASTAGEDFLYGRLERWDEELDDRDVIGRPATSRDMLYGMRCHHQAIFCRKRIFDRIGNFDTQYRTAADYDWTVRVFQDPSVTRRFVPVIVATMRRGGLSDQTYLQGIRERRRIVRAAYGSTDVARFLVYSVFGDYLRHVLQRVARDLGVLPLVRRLKRRAEAVRERLLGSEAGRREASNTAWLTGESLLRMAVGLPLGILIARHLGPEGFGTYSFALAFAALFLPLAGFGLDRIVVRDLVHAPGATGSVLGSAFGLRLLTGAASYALAFLTISVLRPGDGLARALVAIVACAAVFKAFDAVDLWYQSRVASARAVLARSISFVAVSGLRLALVVAGASVAAFAWAWLAESALTALALLVAYLSAGGRVSWSFDRGTVERLVRDAWPLVLTSGLLMIYMRIDQVMLGQMTGNHELGLYSTAVRLVEVWYVLPTAIVASVYPRLMEAHAAGEEELQDRMEKLYRTLTLMSYVIALPTTLLAGWVVHVLFGASFRGAGPMLAVLIWSLPFTSLGVARGAYLTAWNWTRHYLATVAIGCAVNVGLNLVLIPRWGGMGAVIASVLAYWVAAHGSCFLFARLRPTGFRMTRALVRPGL